MFSLIAIIYLCIATLIILYKIYKNNFLINVIMINKFNSIDNVLNIIKVWYEYSNKKVYYFVMSKIFYFVIGYLNSKFNPNEIKELFSNLDSCEKLEDLSNKFAKDDDFYYEIIEDIIY